MPKHIGYENSVPGWGFGDPWGISMNLALPFAKVQEAFERLEKYVFCVKKLGERG